MLSNKQLKWLQSAYKNEEGIVGVPTGLTDLDSRLGGMHKQDLIIIAGRPSMGKTALATNIAFHAAKNIEKKGFEVDSCFFFTRNVFGTTFNKNTFGTVKNKIKRY